VASHLAEIPGWIPLTLQQDQWDIHPAGGEPYRTPQLTSRQQILESFDKNVAAAREALASVSDEALAQNWSLLAGGQPLLTMPRVAVVRTFVLNHSIHHRAYLCSYLRLNDIPVPGLYGPSGDDES
jgi:uncharacterized damage-inducible protein DinB